MRPVVSEMETFAEFYEERFAPLSRLAFLLCGSGPVADEIAQDACEQVLRRWSEIEHPRQYARIAVVNACRSRGRRQRVADAVRDPAPRPATLDTDAMAVRAALAELPERQREIVVLRYYADLKVDDIALELGLPTGTVKSGLHRAHAQLRSVLREVPT